MTLMAQDQIAGLAPYSWLFYVYNCCFSFKMAFSTCSTNSAPQLLPGLLVAGAWLEPEDQAVELSYKGLLGPNYLRLVGDASCCERFKRLVETAGWVGLDRVDGLH